MWSKRKYWMSQLFTNVNQSTVTLFFYFVVDGLLNFPYEIMYSIEYIISYRISVILLIFDWKYITYVLGMWVSHGWSTCIVDEFCSEYNIIIYEYIFPLDFLLQRNILCFFKRRLREANLPRQACAIFVLFINSFRFGFQDNWIDSPGLVKLH